MTTVLAAWPWWLETAEALTSGARTGASASITGL